MIHRPPQVRHTITILNFAKILLLMSQPFVELKIHKDDEISLVLSLTSLRDYKPYNFIYSYYTTH